MAVGRLEAGAVGNPDFAAVGNRNFAAVADIKAIELEVGKQGASTAQVDIGALRLEVGKKAAQVRVSPEVGTQEYFSLTTCREADWASKYSVTWWVVLESLQVFQVRKGCHVVVPHPP